MANPSTVVSIAAAWRPWDPTSLEAFMGTSYVDLRFSGGGGDKTPIRLLANGDTRLYGELILQLGLLRSYSGFGLTSYASTDPLVSFRKGNGAGNEKLRINNNGSIQSAAGAPLVLMAEVPTGGSDGFALTLGNDAPSGKSALSLSESTGTILTISGRSSGAGNQSAIRGFGSSGLRVLAQDQGLNQYTPLELAGGSVAVRCYNGVTLALWGTLTVSSVSGIAHLDTTRKLVLTANDGGTYKDVEIGAGDVKLTANTGNVRLADSGGTTRVQFDLGSGNATLSPSSGHSADLALDATASGGSAKRWTIRSGNSSGRLMLMNVTDSLQVDVETDGSVYSPGFLGTKVVTSAPGSGDAQAGAMVVYASGGTYRLYVKVDSSTWRSVTL